MFALISFSINYNYFKWHNSVGKYMLPGGTNTFVQLFICLTMLSYFKKNIEVCNLSICIKGKACVLYFLFVI